jgi:hypothetical protein
MLAGQSKDGPGFQSQFFAALLTKVDDGPAVCQLAYPGMLGLIGLSETGIGVFGNEVYDHVARTQGLPVVVFKRLAWQCRTLDEVADLLDASGAATVVNYLIATQEDAGCLELRGRQMARIDMTDDLLVHTNHLLTPQLQGAEDEASMIESDSHGRLTRLRMLIESMNAPVTVDDLFDFYADPAIWAKPKQGNDYQTNAVLITEPSAGRLHFGLSPHGERMTVDFSTKQVHES